ncbi:MAG: putative metal-binding motif-containing protein, partial [Nannocystaceae bacterium]
GEALRTGLYLSTSGQGSFTLVEPEATRYANDGDDSAVVHAMPRELDASGRAQFQLQWTAPQAVGVTELVLWSMTGNSNGDSADDNHATIRQGIAHGCDALTYYDDLDGDGFGDEDSARLSCEPVPGMIEQGGDCNDADGQTYPGAAERCNAVDDNCDGQADEGLEPGIYYPDPDGDGYSGDPSAPEFMCNDTPGYADELGDCAPDDPDVYPGAPELDNGEDDDCDGEIDEDVAGSDGGAEDSGDATEGSGTAGANGTAGEGCSVGRRGSPGAAGMLGMLVVFATTRARRRRRDGGAA